MGLFSLWLNENKQNYPAINEAEKADAVIVGGGLAGITTAYYLAKSGLNVILLEASRIGGGVTGHTSAHITSQHDMTYARWIKRFGKEKAALIARVNEEAIINMRNIIQAEEIQCDFSRQDSFLFTNCRNTIKKLEEEFEAVKSLGIDAYMCFNEYFLLPYISALVYKNQAQFHPLKYLYSLAKAVEKHKGRIYEESRVIHIENGAAYTKEGSVKADNIVICTHNPVINFPGMYFAKMYLHRSYCMAFENTRGVKGLWVSADDKGHTFRMANDYLIICGEDHKCGMQTKKDHYGALKKFAKTISKNVKPVCWWSAQDGITLDNLPYIGKYSKSSKGLFVATGFGKWGMTQSSIAGSLLCDIITAKKNPAEEIYSPQRKIIPAALINGVFQNAATAAHLSDGLFRFGKPLCAHMKCRLKWNNDDNSWDCPCHGSRFNKDGKAIDSPAIHDIEKTYKK